MSMYGDVLQSALHGMIQTPTAAHVGQPPNVGLGSPPALHAQNGQTKMAGAPAQQRQQQPKTLQEVLHGLLENTSAKMDGHELMDLIRAAVQHGQKPMQDAANGAMGAYFKTGNAINASPAGPLLNAVLGGAPQALGQ